MPKGSKLHLEPIHQDKIKNLITFLSYDPDTGIFTWVKRRGGTLPGTVAGRSDKKRYSTIGGYCAQILAWYIMTDSFPKEEIDHINRDKSDNRWKNLREVDHNFNMFNSAKRCFNLKGAKNISYRPDRPKNPYHIAFMYKGKTIHAGCFPTMEQAIEARNIKIQELYPNMPILELNG